MEKIDAKILYGNIATYLKNGETVSVRITGNSMAPFLYHGRDIIYLEALKAAPQVGQICLYQRENGQYVVHRIVKREKNGTYTIIGDGQNEKEYGIREEQFLGYVYQVKRKNKMEGPGTFWWFFFEKIWIHMIPCRRIIMKIYEKTRKILWNH